MAGWVTGFAQGLSESVQAAIEKEQKTMDDLFKTQFSVRLNRRMDDLSKDRDNLAEASKQLQAYAAYTGGDLYKAGRLYQTAGGDHEEFTKQLAALRKENTDPYSVFKFAEDNGLDYIPTMDQVARAVTTAPTALPFVEDMPAYGGIMSKITEMFGKDADASPYATRQTQRMQQRLQAIAPMPTASTLTLTPLEMAIDPTTGKPRHMLTKGEVTAQRTAEARMKSEEAAATFAQNTLFNRERAEEIRAGTAEIEFEIAKATKDARINHFNNKDKLMQHQEASAKLNLNLLEKFGEQEYQAKVDTLLATLEEKKNPRDFEQAYMGIFHERMKIERTLNSDDPNIPIWKRQELASKSRILMTKENQILAAQAQFDPATATDPYKHFAGINNSFHKTVMHHIGLSTLAGSKDIIYMPSGDGQTMIPTFRGEEGGQQKFMEIINGAKRDFYSAHVLGVDANGQVQYRSEAGEAAIQQNLGTDYKNVMERGTIYKNKYPTAQSYRDSFLKDPRYIGALTTNNSLNTKSIAYTQGISDLKNIYGVEEGVAVDTIKNIFKEAKAAAAKAAAAKAAAAKAAANKS